MSDLVLDSVTSGYNLSLINSNFQKIQDKINTSCLQVSQGDNVMSQDLDMNSYALLNAVTNFSNNGSMLTVADAKSHFYQIGLVPTTTNDTDAINYGQVSQMIEASAVGTDPANVALYSVLASTTNGTGASLVGIQDVGGKYAAGTVEEALQELAGDSGANIIGYKPNNGISRTLAEKLAESVSALDYIPKSEHAAIFAGTSTLDVTAYINQAINEGKRVYLPTGRYTVKDMITLQRGQCLFGDGRTDSILYVPSDFNMTALGVVRLSDGETGASLDEIGIEFYQDTNNTVRANVIKYPPGIYAVSAPRFELGNVRISKAWVGMDATGNSGGAYIDRLEVGALDTGIKIDGSLDFFHINSYHFWCFGMTGSPLYTSVFSDGTTKASSIGQCESLTMNMFSTFKGIAEFTGSGSSTIGRNISIMQLDGDGARLVYNGRDLQIGQLYTTKTGGTVESVVVTDGRLVVNSLKMNVAGNTGVLVSGGLLEINGGYLSNASVGSYAASVTGGEMRISNCHLEIPAAPRSVGYIVQSGTGILVATDNVATTSGANGPAIDVSTDVSGTLVSNNRVSGWTINLPSGAVLGCYGPNAVNKYGFSPTIGFSTNGDCNPTYTLNQGYYWYESTGIRFQIRVLANIGTYSTASGVLVVKGLPFSSFSGLDYGSLDLGLWSKVTLDTGYTQLGAVLSTSGSYIHFRQSGSGKSHSSISPTNVPSGTTNVEISISGFIPSR